MGVGMAPLAAAFLKAAGGTDCGAGACTGVTMGEGVDICLGGESPPAGVEALLGAGVTALLGAGAAAVAGSG